MAMANIIGNNIKTLRDGMGFNQSNIARFLNVDQSLISKVEKGERILSADMLEKLASLFGVSVDAIEDSRKDREISQLTAQLAAVNAKAEREAELAPIIKQLDQIQCH